VKDLQRSDSSENSDDVTAEDGAGQDYVLALKPGITQYSQKIVRVLRSTLENDPTLIELKNHLQVKKFDPNTFHTNIEREVFIEADPYIYGKFKKYLVHDEIKEKIKNNKLADRLPADLHHIKSLQDPAIQNSISKVTEQLKKEGLWRDEDKDLTMTDAFPLSQAKLDPRFRELDSRVIENGTHLENDDLTHQDFETSSESAHSHIPYGPKMSEPRIHNLMRVSPESLLHQVARRLSDSDFFESSEYKKLKATCYIYSKSVDEEWHFDVLMSKGLSNTFDHFTFTEYKINLPKIKKIIRHFIKKFFDDNPRVKYYLKQNSDPDKQNPHNFWCRFNDVWQRLTIKQKNALTKVFMQAEPMTYFEAAKDFKISLDSLQSRIKTAKLQFKKEFPELEGITPRALPRRELRGSRTLNGLWAYENANIIHTVYKIDPKTGLKIELEWNKTPKSKNLDWKTVAQIKAKILENTPVPLFHETDYFDGMKPTIMSFGRRPGNLIETVYEHTDTTEEGYRDRD